MKKKSKARRLTNDAGRNVGRKLTLDEFVNPLARSGAGMPNLLRGDRISANEVYSKLAGVELSVPVALGRPENY